MSLTSETNSKLAIPFPQRFENSIVVWHDKKFAVRLIVSSVSLIFSSMMAIKPFSLYLLLYNFTSM